MRNRLRKKKTGITSRDIRRERDKRRTGVLQVAHHLQHAMWRAQQQENRDSYLYEQIIEWEVFAILYFNSLESDLFSAIPMHCISLTQKCWYAVLVNSIYSYDEDILERSFAKFRELTNFSDQYDVTKPVLEKIKEISELSGQTIVTAKQGK